MPHTDPFAKCPFLMHKSKRSNFYDIIYYPSLFNTKSIPQTIAQNLTYTKHCQRVMNIFHID